MNESTPPVAIDTVRVERTINASPTFLFRCFTESELLQQWWAARVGAQVCAQLDVRVGGRFKVTFLSKDGLARITTGTYQSIAKPNDLSFTWKWGEAESTSEETLVRVEFLPRATGTKLILTHGPFSTDEAYHAHLDGWLGSTGYLQQILRTCLCKPN